MAKKETLYDQLKSLHEFGQELEIEKGLLIDNAMRSDNPKDILFAQKILRENTQGQKSYILDPLNTNEFNGYRSRPAEVSFSYLRSMARNTPIISSIVTTRKEQVSSYCNYSNDPLRPGWRIEKNIQNYFGDDEEIARLKKVDREERKEITKIINFVENCGVKKRTYHGDDLESFFRKFIDDAMILDQATFEIIPTKNYKPYEFFCTDGSTYRFASPSTMEDSAVQRGYLPYAVQIYQGSIHSSFYPWELCLGIRNPTTDIKNNGYGVSELELLMKVVTYILYSESYNGKFFSQGSNPKGLFVAEGNYSEDRISELRQSWRSQVAGVNNAWKIPFLAGTKIQWIDMQKSNADMEFYKWIEYLTRLACAIYKIDPRELGLNLDASDGGINYESSIQNKLVYSKEKGLIPLLRFIEKKLNKYIVFPLSNGKYKFSFTGVDDIEEMIVKLDIEKLEKGVMTWKEFRRKYKLPETIAEDDFLLNTTYISLIQYLAQMKQNGNIVDDESERDIEIVDNGMDSDIANVFKEFNNDNPFLNDLEKAVKSIEEGFDKK